MEQGVYQHAFVAMNTLCRLQTCGKDAIYARTICEEVQVEVIRLSQRYNFHEQDSWLSQTINRRSSGIVELDTETAQILATVRKYAELTKDAFDITVGTLTKAMARAKTVAEASSIHARLRAYCGTHTWHLENTQLHFLHPATQFDLGGVIKEYAVDKAATMLRQANIKNAFINFGGDVFAIGAPAQGGNYMATIPDPSEPQVALFALSIEDQALTTSAHYFRQRQLKLGKIKDKKERPQTLSHIFGKKNQNSAWCSVSAVADSALVAGIYSTALLVNDNIQLPPNTMAFAVDQARQIHTLQG